MNQGGSVSKDKDGKVITSRQTKPEERDSQTNIRKISDEQRLKSKNIKPAIQAQSAAGTPSTDKTPATDKTSAAKP